MTYVDSVHFHGTPLKETGRVHIAIDRIFHRLKCANQTCSTDFDGLNAGSEERLAKRRLSEVQREISAFSMHLPKGFAIGLSGQFANMLGEDAWEEEDELPSLATLTTFLNMLISTGASRRPGIGTNGRGSITAFWNNGADRLTVDCFASDEVSWILTLSNSEGSLERTSGNCSLTQLPTELALYDLGIWFGQ